MCRVPFRVLAPDVHEPPVVGSKRPWNAVGNPAQTTSARVRVRKEPEHLPLGTN